MLLWSIKTLLIGNQVVLMISLYIVVVFPAPLWPKKDVIWLSKKLMFRELTAGRELPSNIFTRSWICTPITRPRGSGSNSWPAQQPQPRELPYDPSKKRSVLFTCGITKGKLESHFQHISFFTQSQIRPTIQLSSSHSLFLNFVKLAHSLLCHVRNELPYLSSRCPQRAPIFEPIPSRLSVTAHLIFTFRLRVLNLLLLVGTFFLASQLLLVPLQLLPLALVLAGLPAAWAITGVHLWAAPVLNIHLDVFRFWLLRICRVDSRGGK